MYFKSYVWVMNCLFEQECRQINILGGQKNHHYNILFILYSVLILNECEYFFQFAMIFPGFSKEKNTKTLSKIFH